MARTYLLILTVSLLATISAYLRVLEKVDLTIFDLYQKYTQIDIPPNVLVVEIDEKSLEALGQWPWTRSRHAELIEKLNRLGTKTIAYDVIFAEQNHADPMGDRLLASAIKTSGNAVLPIFIAQMQENGIPIEATPAPIFNQAKPILGHVHIDCSPDSICRSVFLMEGVGNPQWPHISLAASPTFLDSKALPGARRTAEILAPDNELIHRDYHNYLLFPSQKPFFKTISFIDILDGEFQENSFKEYTVFVGVTATGLGDMKSTPSGLLPGVYIHTLIFDALNNDRLIQRTPALPLALITGLFTLFSLLLFARLSPSLFLMLTLISSIAALSLSGFIFHHFYLWIPSASLICALLLFYPLQNWLKIHLALKFIKQQLRRITEIHEHRKDILLSWESNEAVPKHSKFGASEIIGNSIQTLERINELVDKQRFVIDNTLNSLNEAIILTDREGEILLLNESSKKLINLSEKVNIKTLSHLFSIATGQEATSWEEFVKSVCETPTRVEIEKKSTDQTHPTLSLVCTATTRDFSTPEGFNYHFVLFSFVDISDLKQSEQSKLDTLNFLSHDLRSPMVSILAIINNLPDSASDETYKEAIKKISLHTEKNIQYSEKILQLSRARDLKTDQFFPIDIHSVFDNAIFDSKDIARSKGINFNIVRENSDLWVLGNQELLERALINLITNAIKYSPADSTIIIGQKLDTKSVVIFVENEGPGMDKNTLKGLFGRFQRPNLGTQRRGVGLGLFFVKTVATKHGGFIAAESEINEFSRFTVYLPIYNLNESLHPTHQ